MTYKSLPSARSYIVDAPEVKDFYAEFKYNFFERDERINNSGDISPRFAKRKSVLSLDTSLSTTKEFNRFTSRYINLTWKTISDPENVTINRDINITDNINKIHEEQDFMARNFIRVEFNENGKDDYVKNIIHRMMDEQGIKREEKDLSPMDLIKILKPAANQAIDTTLISEAIADTIDDGILFINKIGHVKEETVLKNIAGVKNSLAINKKYISSALKSTEESGVNIFADELRSVFEEAEKIQEEQQYTAPSNVVSAEDYDFEVVEFVDYKKVDPEGYKPKKQFLGYIIEKTEIDGEDIETKMEPIVIENIKIGSYIDPKIKYGATYIYTIKSVVLLESLVEDLSDDDGEFVLLQYLVSSRPSKEIIIDTIETVPPPEPADFNVRWLANSEELQLSWNFPVNTQRDIKQWQVFRRSSIYEPFELQKVYDFNDSVIIDTDDYQEFPDEVLVEELDSPKNFFVDPDFTKDSVFIYAVCAIDAHGLSSNYSTQFIVGFDRAKNKLIKNLISIGGAPKPYPNMLIDQDLFVDTIKTSNAQRVRLIFTPEYLDLVDAENNNLDLLKTSDESYYQISMINVDLQEQQNIKIKLEDRRQTEDPKAPPPSKLTKKPLRFGLRRRV